jgi:hypothetical protein
MRCHCQWLLFRSWCVIAKRYCYVYGVLLSISLFCVPMPMVIFCMWGGQFLRLVCHYQWLCTWRATVNFISAANGHCSVYGMALIISAYGVPLPIGYFLNMGYHRQFLYMAHHCQRLLSVYGVPLSISAYGVPLLMVTVMYMGHPSISVYDVPLPMFIVLYMVCHCQ